MTEFDEDKLAEAYERALRLEKAGETDAAEAAWREVLALDPSDHGGAAIRLAALGRAPDPDKAPDAYVETLFDQHAAAFDEILVDQLGYAIPLQLRQALLDHAPGPYARGLDLGCGTGLTGSALDGMVTDFIGVDLSERMVELADERDVYDGLYVAEAVDFVENIEDEEPWDLVAATDVMPYLGDMERIAAGVARRTNAGAVFAFSTETMPGEAIGPKGWRVTPKHRFAHSPAYLEAVLLRHGFTILHIEPVTVRMDEGQPIPGHLVLARKMNG
ncbi:S-adenosylmethionine-dependent methyltransferase [Zhengella mangrovi]|uniref:S-adenosylmethionine-dependent methyltransferase n=1 Tax=Zhengella mangrovi TaxID=1982044 RepID=A0A2G1QHW2_9HYPH|nr:methyltransferase [Zhengella mangrovi]PHP65106.1 S-adenosylmethionine-dependent methyltransferase [Zhengella mangrovi]